MTTPPEPTPAADEPSDNSPAPANSPAAHAPSQNSASDGRAHVERSEGATDGRHDAPDSEALDESLWAAPKLHVDEPGEFIAAVPALLGFVPQRSLVACMLQQEPDRPGAVVLGAVARHDLDLPGCGSWLRLAGQLATICRQERAVGVVVLIVDDRAGAPRAGRPGARAARHRDLIQVLGAALHAEEVEIADAWAVREIATEALWWDLRDSDSVGLQPDPAASPVALAQVLDGRPIRSCRGEMTALVEMDPAARDAVAEVLGEVCTEARQRSRQAACRCDPASYSRAALDRVMRRVAAVGADTTLSPCDIAEVAVALRDSTVRDAMFALALGESAAAAEVVWSLVCRSSTGPDRAEAATLLGYSAYVNGDGPFAGVALEAALDADPRHGIAELLDTALRTGMPPRDVRKLALSGRAKAAGLGVEIPIEPIPHER